MSNAILLFVCAIILVACSNDPPGNIDDICEIFREEGGWYEDAKRSYERWGVPIHVQLAIIYQESGFWRYAKTDMQYVLWIIPVGRLSSAYGYAQAKEETWIWYMQSTKNRGADRNDFDDAVDFVGWYVNKSNEMLEISKWDAYNQYLAYHEGQGGFRRKTYNQKPWLINVAKKVDKLAGSYREQLKTCEDEFKSSWWEFWK